MKVTLALCLSLVAGSNAGGLADVRSPLLDSCLSDIATFEGDALDSASCDQVTADDAEDDYENLIVESTYQVEPPVPVADTNKLGADLGLPQVLDPAYSDAILKSVEDARVYMQEMVMKEPKYELVRDVCENKHELCAFWAVLGECINNPGYMHLNCAPQCGSCELVHVGTRCPMDPDAVDALYPGDLNRMFEKIVSDPFYQQFEPVVLSRPSYAPGDSSENATYIIGHWMVLFENALSDEEAERMIELGGLKGYERSSDVGEARKDGTFSNIVNSGRTSTNAWCTDECYVDPVAQRLMARIANITGIPEPNQENLQLLRYEKDQFYQTHNDYIPYQVERPCGVRVLTYYMYLNDVEEGGGTNFPELDMTVQAKRGRAVLWPSVFDEDPNKKDKRSDHQAMPVIKGSKYGANAWIHQRDFKTPNNNGC